MVGYEPVNMVSIPSEAILPNAAVADFRGAVLYTLLPIGQRLSV